MTTSLTPEAREFFRRCGSIGGKINARDPENAKRLKKAQKSLALIRKKKKVD